MPIKFSSEAYFLRPEKIGLWANFNRHIYVLVIHKFGGSTIDLKRSQYIRQQWPPYQNKCKQYYLWSNTSHLNGRYRPVFPQIYFILCYSSSMFSTANIILIQIGELEQSGVSNCVVCHKSNILSGSWKHLSHFRSAGCLTARLMDSYEYCFYTMNK